MTIVARRGDLLEGMLTDASELDIEFTDPAARNTEFNAATQRFATITDVVTKLTSCVALEPPGGRRDYLSGLLTRAQALKDREQAELDAATAANIGYTDALARHEALQAAVASIQAALDIDPPSPPPRPKAVAPQRSP